MAAPSYTTDLVDITLAESTTGWTALGGGASGLGTGADFSMQGSLCVDKQVTSAEKGQVYDNGSTITPGSAEHFFVWVFLATPGLADTLANRGLAIIAGTATNAYVAFHVEGSDTYGAGGRVGKCYPIRYLNTASGSAPYRTLTGSPGANPRYFGATANITASVKSANLGTDAQRRGTGMYITAGDATTPGTFAGAAGVNDSVSNRWGILSLLGGSVYELQGRLVVGQNSSGTPTAARFEDSNKTILFVDTPHSSTDFSQLIVDHASSVLNLTNITFEAAGTHNPGRVVFNNASTVSALDGCTFSRIGITTLRAGVTATGCTWRGCGQVTSNGASFDGCLFSGSTASAAVVVANLSELSECSFVSSGTGHAVDLGTVASTSTMTWDNAASGYASSDGSTGNETIRVSVASGQTLTINVASGATTPSIKNDGAGSVSVVSGQVDLVVTVVDTDGSPIQSARVYVIAAAGGGLSAGTVIIDKALTDASGQTSDTRSYSSNQPITGWVRKSSAAPYYKESSIAGTISNASGVAVTIQMISDE